jgi:hypothetical protein
MITFAQFSDAFPLVILFMGIMAGLWFFCFRAVDARSKRRLLQNMVWHGYAVLRWMLAVWQAVDQAVLRYYQTMDATAIRPFNEDAYPALVTQELEAKHYEPEENQCATVDRFVVARQGRVHSLLNEIKRNLLFYSIHGENEDFVVEESKRRALVEKNSTGTVSG